MGWTHKLHVGVTMDNTQETRCRVQLDRDLVHEVKGVSGIPGWISWGYKNVCLTGQNGQMDGQPGPKKW
jgi:hypothetical protein